MISHDVYSGSVGVVAIGRNEGERLKRCLRSALDQLDVVVYVDSGSSDGSVEFAHSVGAEVVELDMTRPFTMARARNAGFQRLMEIAPDVEYVQFVDGDCEVVDGWINAAWTALDEHPDVGSVGGHRTEIDRNGSIYNRITDMHWPRDHGETCFLGGDVMMRAEAFQAISGYMEHMIAGEDPEICVRLRAAGWKLLRLDRDMTRHDAAMTRFGQWWRREVRAGYAYAERERMHRALPERPWRRQVWRHWLWGVLLPAAAIIPAWPTYGLSLTLLTLYPIWMIRLMWSKRSEGVSTNDAWAFAFFCMIAKFPLALGQGLYWWRRMLSRPMTLIEYKEQPSSQVTNTSAMHDPDAQVAQRDV